MNRQRTWAGVGVAVFAAGAIGCAVGAAVDSPGFFRAWLCAFVLSLGLPLGGVALVLVHDLSGGEWMASARPAVDAAILTMPLATLAGIPVLFGLPALYAWTHPAGGLANAFYLNGTGFVLRYGADVVLWNLLAAFALWAPRGPASPVVPGLSWLSGLGLILLAFSASFAAIDWVLSLEPHFWSSVFPMIAASGWFNTGLAVVLLAVALGAAPAGGVPRHIADLAAILLATTIFWAYVEFVQFLIIWEENLNNEIAWYLPRLAPLWRWAALGWLVFGFGVPFLVLLWGPAKRRRAVVAATCAAVLLGRIAETWWLILPEFDHAGPFWLDAAALLALGAAMVLLFGWALRRGGLPRPAFIARWSPSRG